MQSNTNSLNLPSNSISQKTSDPNLSNYSSIALQKGKIASVLVNLETLEQDLLNAIGKIDEDTSDKNKTDAGSVTSKISPSDPTNLTPPKGIEAFSGHNKMFENFESIAIVKNTPEVEQNNLNKNLSTQYKNITALNKKNSETVNKINLMRGNIEDLEKKLQATENAIKNSSQPIPDENPSNIQSVERLRLLAQMRIDLLEALLATYVEATNNSAQAKVNLVDQLTLQEVASKNIMNAQATLNNLTHTKTAHQRLAEINTYYAKEYAARTGVMKILVFTCIPLLIIALLKKKNIIPTAIANIASIIISIIGLIIFIRKIYDLSDRSNMNYDEYIFEVESSGDGKKRRRGAGGVGIWDYNKKQLKKLFNQFDNSNNSNNSNNN